MNLGFLIIATTNTLFLAALFVLEMAKEKDGPECIPMLKKH